MTTSHHREDQTMNQMNHKHTYGSRSEGRVTVRIKQGIALRIWQLLRTEFRPQSIHQRLYATEEHYIFLTSNSKCHSDELVDELVNVACQPSSATVPQQHHNAMLAAVHGEGFCVTFPSSRFRYIPNLQPFF